MRSTNSMASHEWGRAIEAYLVSARGGERWTGWGKKLYGYKNASLSGGGCSENSHVGTTGRRLKLQSLNIYLACMAHTYRTNVFRERSAEGEGGSWERAWRFKRRDEKAFILSWVRRTWETLLRSIVFWVKYNLPTFILRNRQSPQAAEEKKK